jgi:hypothetical protein
MKKKVMYVRYTGRNNWFAIHGKVYAVVMPRGYLKLVFIKDTGYFISKENFEVLSAPEVMLYKARVSGKTCGNWKVQK